VNEVVFALAGELRKLGWRPLIAVATWSRDEQLTEWRGVPIVNLQLRNLADCHGVKSLAAFLVASVRDALELRDFIRHENVGVIDFHFPSLETVVPAMMRFVNVLGCRLLLSFHGRDVVDLLNLPHRLQRVWQFVLKQCDGITACSNSLRNQLKGFMPGADVKAVYNGVDHNLFAVPRKTGRQRPLLLQVAKFEHKKAQDITLRALRQLLHEGLAADLLLVGSDGPELDQIRALITELGLAERARVRVNVPHDDIPTIMAQADILVHPSRLEPFGLVLLEAGVVGLPVVATRVGGVPELLTDNETGLLVEPDDATALAEAIRRLLTDREFAERIASSWHNNVLSRWTWAESARGRLDAAFA
jgi:glycosyltransferase involved in cell wall biosynthesis